MRASMGLEQRAHAQQGARRGGGSSALAARLRVPSARPAHHCQRQQQRQRAEAYSGAYGGGYVPPEEPQSEQRDVLQRAFDFCGAALSRGAAVAVGRAADVLQAVVPRATPRAKVETAVRGALTLLALALVKSVLSVVLVLGAAVLALYVATQLFGWDVSVEHRLPPQQPPGAGQWPPQGAPWQQPPPQQQPYGGQPQYGQAQPQYGQPQQQQWQGQGQRYGPPPPGRRPQQGDVIDVFR